MQNASIPVPMLSLTCCIDYIIDHHKKSVFMFASMAANYLTKTMLLHISCQEIYANIWGVML